MRMRKKIKFFADINKISVLLKFISYKRRFQLFKVLVLMMISAFLDVLSIISAIPFLYIVSNNYEKILSSNIYLKISSILKIEFTDVSNLILGSTLVFVSAVVVNNLVRLINLWAMLRIADLIAIDLGCLAYKCILNKEYIYHTKINSSSNINLLDNNTKELIVWIHHYLKVISSFLSISLLFSGFLIYNPQLMFSTSLVLIFLYLIYIKFVKFRLSENSNIIIKNNINLIRNVSESFGNIRDLIINKNYNTYLRKYHNYISNISLANSQKNIINQAPKYLIEMIAFVIISLVAFIFLLNKRDTSSIIPTLGLIAISGQKILPNVQQIFSAWATTLGLSSSVNIFIKVLKDLNKKENLTIKSKSRRIFLESSIELRDISFQYSKNSPKILNNITIKINKGERIGIFGTTGGGKSSLLDILAGLLEPSEGSILIDGRNSINKKDRLIWQSSIAFVPQNIFLSDGSFSENIAIGLNLSQIDMNRVKLASKKAQIYDFICSTKNGFNTFVGENGIKLSGGQKQRIAIARAIYRDANFLIFDEATSALDEITEKQFMESLNNFDREYTIIFVAHRLKTLSYCDRLFKLDKGKLVEVKI